jgi:hypothetical protein
MTYPDISRDPPRDSEVAGWLTAAEQGSRAGQPDFGGMRAGILARAQLPLARLRRQLPWWEYAANWARPAVPVALAAGLAMIWVVGSNPIPALSPAAEGGVNSLPFLEDVLTSNVPEAEYHLLVSEDAEMEALVNFAFQEM